jgi:anti-anti-sigma factor
MRFEVEEQAGVQVLRLNGELTDEPAEELSERAHAILEAPGARLVVDLSGATYLNSAGLGALVHLTAQANLEERRVALAAPNSFVSGVLEMTKLNKFFDVHDTVESAVAKLKA